MNNEIAALIRAYQSRGISTHAVIEDPLFQSLPMDKQVAVIKAYGDILAKGGIAPSIKGSIIRTLLKMASAGLVVGLPFAAAMPDKTKAGVAVVSTILTAGILGAGDETLSYRDRKRKYEDVSSKLKAAEGGSIDQAISAIMAQRYGTSSLAARIKSEVDSPLNTILQKITPGQKEKLLKMEF